MEEVEARDLPPDRSEVASTLRLCGDLVRRKVPLWVEDRRVVEHRRPGPRLVPPRHGEGRQHRYVERVHPREEAQSDVVAHHLQRVALRAGGVPPHASRDSFDERGPGEARDDVPGLSC